MHRVEFTGWLRMGFYRYNGSVQRLECTVLSYIQQNLDMSQAYKCFAIANKQFNEVWWFYPSTQDSTGEISRYVIYNYLENTWSIGELVRTAWVDEDVFEEPMATLNGYLYNQETGQDADDPAESLVTRVNKDISNNTNELNVRARARQAVIRLQSDDDAATGNRLGVQWRLGYTRLYIQPDGQR
jgi:hypothetical protein